MTHEFNEKMAEISQNMKYIRSDKPVPVLWAVVYWGNQDGDGGATSVFECHLSRESGNWVNEGMGVTLGADGKNDMRKTMKVGYQHGLYVSPNENDAGVFLAGYLASMHLTNQVKEYSTEILYGVAVLVTKNLKMNICPMTFHKQDGSYVEKHTGMVAEEEGYLSLAHKNSEEGGVGEVFLSHNPNDVSMFGSGILMLERLIDRVK